MSGISNKALRRLEAKIHLLSQKDKNLSILRTVVFLLAFVFWTLVGLDIFPKVNLPIAFVITSIFLGLIVIHRKIRRGLKLFQSRLKVEERQIATRNLDWINIPYTNFSSIPSSVPYLTDLNIIGEYSILRLLNWTQSDLGFKQLLDVFLSNNVDNNEIARRKTLVKELESLKLFRNSFLSYRGIDAKPIDMKKISSLLEVPLSSIKSIRGFIWIMLIQTFFVGSFVAAFLGQGNKNILIGSFVLLLIENVRLRKKVQTSTAYGWSTSASHYLDSFKVTIQSLEKFSNVKKPELSKILKVFNSKNSVSSRIRKLERVSGALGVRQNFIVHGIVHLFLPWDILWTYKLDKIRMQIKNDLPIWESAFSEVEAFLSIAMYKAANQDFHDAIIKSDTDTTIEAQNLRHPLIKKELAVGNSLTIDGDEKCILITGSNMSGKSTFMRALGVNYLLAKAGCSVAADSFTFSNRSLYSSLSGGDSLQEGLSSFYAEVKRLKNILDATKEHNPVLFLIDEIFRGTNNRERLLGSQAYIQEIVSRGGRGIVTSHDLELAHLEELEIGIVNYHFKETIKNSEMFFSYEKQKGPCPTTNALQVMRLSGLPT